MNKRQNHKFIKKKFDVLRVLAENEYQKNLLVAFKRDGKICTTTWIKK